MFDFCRRTCYSVGTYKKALTKTVRQLQFSESRWLVQTGNEASKTHHFRAGELKPTAVGSPVCPR